MFSRLMLCGALATVMAPAAFAVEYLPEGYLCCNMRTDGKWITDINYDEPGKHVIPAGTPVMKVIDDDRFRRRIYIMIEGKQQALGNDYSRDLSKEAFLRRYVVAENPKTKIATYPQKIQDAINSSRVMLGMTREQVLMAVGYPVSSENPDLNAGWRFWLNSDDEFDVLFDDKGQVKDIVAGPKIRSRVVAE